MKNKSLFTKVIIVALLSGCDRLIAQTINYPSSLNTTSIQSYSGYNVDNVGGFFNVRDYGAKGDGVTDDTRAIQSALDANRKGIDTQGSPDYFYPRPKTVYFPKGTYIVSSNLVWIGQAMMLMGQGKGETIIQLKNSTPGFTNAGAPKALIKTPEGIHEFRNYIRDMTISVGSGNAGAIGIDFIANNSGGIVNVEVRSEDRTGKAGISMTRAYPGPCMLKKVSVHGFDYAIQTGRAEYSITFENIYIINQRIAGIENDGNILIIRKLTSFNSVPAVRNLNKYGMISILDSDLTGGSGSTSAIDNVTGSLFVRNVTAGGYRSVINNKGAIVSGASVAEYTNKDVSTLFASANRSLNLPIEETPEYHENDMTKWAELSSPRWYGDNSTWESTINSGKSVIYFKTGTYQVKDKFYNVPLSVRKFMGFGAVINDGDQFGMKLVVKDGDENSPPLIIEHIGYGITVEHLCKRPVVIKRCKIRRYISSPQAGKLYLEDVESKNLVTFFPQQKVWARQYNSEILPGQIWNKGADLWVLSIKTELRGYVIKTTDCGRTEVLGGLIYPARTFSGTEPPAFICEDAQHSLIFGVSAYLTNSMHPVLVREDQNGVAKDLKYGGQTRYLIPMHIGSSPNCANSIQLAAPAPGIKPGVYKLTAKHSGKALDVSGTSTANGALVSQTKYLGGADQQWKIEQVDGNYYKMTAVHSGKSLDVRGFSLSNGGVIQQWAWGNTDNQKWSIVAVGSGYYKLVSKQSGKALAVYQSATSDGSSVVQWTYGGGDNYQWKLEPVSANARMAAEPVTPKVANQSLMLWPNPAHHLVNLKWQGFPEESVKIKVVNSQGIVFHQEVVRNSNAHQISISGLKNGFYLMVLTFNQSVITKALIINR